MYTEARIMTERVKGLESRLAATESRLTALESRAEGCITQDEYRARLAALRAPGMGTDLDARDLRNLRDSYKGIAQALAEAEADRDALRASLTEAQGEVARLAKAEQDLDMAKYQRNTADRSLAIARKDAATLRTRLDAAGKLIERVLNAHPRLNGYFVLSDRLLADLHAWGKAS